MRKALAAALAPVAAAALISAPIAHTDENTTPEQDEMFAGLLEMDGFLLNFRLQRFQALRFCEAVNNGQSSLEATRDLAQLGGYSFDFANGMSATAMGVYCPWTIGR